MTELDLIVDLHKNSERQGPGSETETLKAVELMNLPNDTSLKVADLGCGAGGQTLTLAQHLNGHITAVDLFPEFLKELDEKAAKRGLHNKISSLAQSMDKLPFHNEELDLIWSEGAIYTIGFETGIKQWSDFLKPGGYLAVTDATWISDDRPKEIEAFWEKEYPQIDIASNKIKLIEDNGYTLIGYFILAENSWIENYYKPIQSKFKDFLDRHHQSELAKAVVNEYKSEIELYQTYKAYYGYGFYVARKN